MQRLIISIEKKDLDTLERLSKLERRSKSEQISFLLDHYINQLDQTKKQALELEKSKPNFRSKKLVIEEKGSSPKLNRKKNIIVIDAPKKKQKSWNLKKEF